MPRRRGRSRAGTPRRRRGPRRARGADALRVGRALAVDARRARRAAGRPVDHDVRQQHVLREGPLDVAVAVAPRAELLDDPGGQARGRVGQPDRERVGLGAPAAARTGVLRGASAAAAASASASSRPGSRGGGADHEVEVDAGDVVGVRRARASRRPSRPSRRPGRRSARSRAARHQRVERGRDPRRRPTRARAARRRTRSPAARARPRRRRRPGRRRARRDRSAGRSRSRNSTIEPGQPWTSSSGIGDGPAPRTCQKCRSTPSTSRAEPGHRVQPRLPGPPVVAVAQ